MPVLGSVNGGSSLIMSLVLRRYNIIIPVIINKIIAITIGDINGIGIEILIKSWKKRDIKNFILITNYELFSKFIKEKKIYIKVSKSTIKDNKILFNKHSFNIFNIPANDYNHNPLNSLIESYKLVKKNKLI